MPADTDAVEQLLQRLSRLAADIPEIAELDLNPIIITPTGAVVVDIKLRLSTLAEEPEPYTHALEKTFAQSAVSPI